MNIREALMTQGPSLELHRAAQFEIARLDAIIAVQRGLLVDYAKRDACAAPADVCSNCDATMPDGCGGLFADEAQCLRAQRGINGAGQRSDAGNPTPGGNS